MPLGPAQSLITRCPDCGTAFRASAEQLSVRRGQVRCGRCGHVFDARAHAVEMEAAMAATDTPGDSHESDLKDRESGANDEPLYDATSFIAAADDPLPSAAAAADDSSAAPSDLAGPEGNEADEVSASNETLDTPPVREAAESVEQPATDTDAVVTTDESTDESTEKSPADTGHDNDGTLNDAANEDTATASDQPASAFAEVLEEARAEQWDEHQEAARLPEDEHPREDSDAGTELPAGEALTEAVPEERSDPIDVAVAAMPFGSTSAASTVEPLALEFSASRHVQPGLSKWVGIPGIILLLMLLAAQVAYHLRGDLILLFPSIRPAALQVCDWAGCDLPSPQRAELMSIEASDLQADSSNPAVMVLSATLRNRAPFAQAQPALELTLTDAQDQPVARRVIEASDYVIAGIQNGVFPASSELPVKIYFEASAVKATGYRLYLFYP